MNPSPALKRKKEKGGFIDVGEDIKVEGEGIRIQKKSS